MLKYFYDGEKRTAEVLRGAMMRENCAFALAFYTNVKIKGKTCKRC